MHKVQVVGIIGKGSLAPQTITYKKPSDGSLGELYKFGMWVEDDRKTVEDGSHPRHVVRVILPSGDRGKKLLAALSPGRRVMVEGDESSEIRTVTKDGKSQSYLNIDIHMDKLHFMDAPLMMQVNRVLKLLEKAEVISAEQVLEFSGAVENMLNQPKEEDRIDPDPDKPDFIN